MGIIAMLTQQSDEKIVKKCPVSTAWLKKLGVASIVFFTLKGLAWLVVIIGAVYFGLEF